VPSVDVPMTIMFVVFLVLFLGSFLYPVWKSRAAKLRDLLRSRRASRGPAVGPIEEPLAATFETPRQQLLLNDFDVFILRRLALAGRRGLSRRQLQAELHFSPGLTGKTLASLQERGLIRMVMPLGFASRFCLSARGRDFAVEQGYLPAIRKG
jgi:hypothetical protein